MAEAVSTPIPSGTSIRPVLVLAGICLGVALYGAMAQRQAAPAGTLSLPASRAAVYLGGSSPASGSLPGGGGAVGPLLQIAARRPDDGARLATTSRFRRQRRMTLQLLSPRYIPGYLPRYTSRKSVVSATPCATIGTIRLRPVPR